MSAQDCKLDQEPIFALALPAACAKYHLMKQYIVPLFAGLIMALSLAACVETTSSAPVQRKPPTQVQPLPNSVATRNFNAVVARMEPIIERQCRNRTQGANCDFKIIVHPDASRPPNAYQTLDKSGRPVIGFTQKLIANMQNRDEIAFVLGHESAHHIRGHIPKTQQNALAGAFIGTIIAAGLGVDAKPAQDVGASIGARRFSKGFELEADELGTIITHRAGYDPLRGSLYFQRIPDPGDKFLGTHPPNAERQAIVQRTAASL